MQLLKFFPLILLLIQQTLGYGSQGKIVSINQVPYMVSVIPRKCNGVLISPNTVLTTGECAIDMIDIVQIGVSNLDAKNITTLRVINKVINCPKKDAQYSMALLTLERSVKMSDKAKPVDIDFEEIDSKSICIFVSYGTSGVLKMYEVDLMADSTKSCKHVWSRDRKWVYCSNSPILCEGNTGGPLVCNNQLVGLVKIAVCDDKAPQIYNKLYRFKDFISNEMSVCAGAVARMHSKNVDIFKKVVFLVLLKIFFL